MLRPDDARYLDEHAIRHTVVDDPQGTHVVLHDVAPPAGLNPPTVDILVTLPPGFNDVGPDMFWCTPFVTRADGQPIAGADVPHDFQGRTWQRWSRHIGASWRPGIDNLGTYIAYVRRALAQAAPEAA